MKLPLIETLSISTDALRANTMRSLLTMLGIVIGIASVITMVALGNGAQNAIKERIARLGTTVLQINPQRVSQGGVHTASTAKLTTKDVDMIRERAPNVVAVNWQQDRDLQVVWKNRKIFSRNWTIFFMVIFLFAGKGRSLLPARRMRL